MAFYRLSEWFANEQSIVTKRQLCMEVVNGKTIRPKPQMVRERSRGRHDPGDGPYTNRMAFGGETRVDVPGDSTQYILQGNNYVYHPTQRIYEDWTNCTFCRLDVRSYPYGWGYTLKVTSWSWQSGYIWNRYYSTSSYGFSEADAIRAGLQVMDQWKGADYMSLPVSGSYYVPNRITGAMVSVLPKLSNQFLGPIDTLDAGYVNRRIETGLATAFVEACDGLPSTTGINNIANICDIVSSFKSMSKGLTKLGSAADAWLGYRYSYSTTKSDIQAVSDFANRLAALPTCIHSNGYFKDGEYEYRASISVESSYLSSLVSLGEKWGLALDPLTAWDLVPYSFIVDWFLPVSRLLENWQSQSFAMQIQQTCWCSVRREYVNEFGFKEIDYSRFLYDPHARFSSVSRMSYGPKASTIVKRALDVLALFA